MDPVDIEVESRTSIGLAPDFSTLNAFLAAAGVSPPFVHIQATAQTDTFLNHPQFTEAAAFQDLPDPPFVQAGWAAAEFKVCRLSWHCINTLTQHSSSFPLIQV